jgi:hypothetical protein
MLLKITYYVIVNIAMLKKIEIIFPAESQKTNKP